MAIGFTPKATQRIDLGALPQPEALALAVMAAEELDWPIIYLSDTGLMAHTSSQPIGWNAEVLVKFENGVMTAGSSSTGGEMWDLGRNRKALRRFLERFAALQERTTGVQRQERYRDLGALLTPSAEDRLLLPPPTAREKAADTLSMFRPAQGYLVTPLLLIANIAVFIVMLLNGASVMDPASEVLIRWGANFTPRTLDGEWWRLLSNVFIHIGVIHLLMNMYALLYIGAMLEPRIGSLRFAVAYFVTGIGASLASLWWHPVVLSAGASGAIFGMYGVFLAMLTTNLIERDTRKSMLSSIGVFVVYNLMFGMRGGVDNAAHIGGLVCGIVVGYAIYPSLRRPDRPGLRALTLAGILLCAAGGFMIAARTIHSDTVSYQENLERFSANEERFLGLIKVPDPADDSAYAQALRMSIPIWEENLKLVYAGQHMDLPDAMRVRNDNLVRYSQLRLQEVRLALDAAEGRPGQDSLQTAVHEEVSRLLEQMNK